MSDSEEKKISSPRKVLGDLGMYDDLSNLVMELAGKDAKGSDLSNKDLSNTNYDGYDFDGSDLENSNMKDCTFVGSIVDNCNFNDSNLEGVDFRVYSMDDAKLNRAKFKRANLENLIMRGVEVVGAIFNKANLANSLLMDGIMGNTSFKGANMRGFGIENVGISKDTEEVIILFKHADLAVANLEFIKSEKLNVKLSGAKLNGAKLINSRSFNQEMKKTDFSRAIIQDTLFEKIVFSDCKFTRTLFQRVRFSKCIFNNVNFDYTSVENIKFENCNFNKCNFREMSAETQINFDGVKMVECVFDGCVGSTFDGKFILEMSFNNKKAEFIRCRFNKTDLSLRETGNSRLSAGILLRGPGNFFLIRSTFTNLNLYMELVDGRLGACSFTSVGISEASKIKKSLIAECTFDHVELNGFDLIKNSIKDVKFKSCDIVGSKIKDNTMEGLLFEKTFFRSTLFEKNHLIEVTFENADFEEGTFLNGESGFTFIDSKSNNTIVPENGIPGLTPEPAKVNIKTKSKTKSKTKK